jgi:Ca2+/Na+ antiporter
MFRTTWKNLFMKQNLKIVVVIFLTVFFSIIGVSISNTRLLIVLLMALMVLFFVFVLVFSIQKTNRINESVPSFLNFVNLTMSTGKSFAHAFESAILYQNTSIRPYYKRIHHRVFYLKHPNSGFFFKSHQVFYKNIFQISIQNINQREKVNKLKIKTIEFMETKRKEKSLRMPFKIQTYVFCILYALLLFWHFGFRTSYPQIEFLSLIFFISGLIFSIFIGQPKIKI